MIKKISVIFLLVSMSLLFSQFRGSNTVDYNPRDLLLGNANGDYSFFDMNNITLDHSFSMSYVSDSKNSGMQNEYVAGLNFRFSDPLFMRVELGASYIPYSTYSAMEENQMPEVYLKSASLHYQISKNSHLSIEYKKVSNFENLFNPYNNSLNWYNDNFINTSQNEFQQVKIGFE